MLLTGTPLQNTVEELFSLLHFLEPGRFPSETTFMQEFGDLKTEEQVNLPCILTFLFRYCEFIHFIVSGLHYLFFQIIPIYFLEDHGGFIFFCLFIFIQLKVFCFWPKVILPYHCFWFFIFSPLSIGHAETGKNSLY